MAVLPDNDRRAIWANLMRQISARNEGLGVTKADILAAVQAADDWVDTNASSFNSAIPQPARSSLAAKQKIELLMFVLRRRWEVL